MKKLTKKEIINSLKIIILAVVLSTGIGSLTAWQGPEGAPTTCTPGHIGCEAPLHRGAEAQTKDGGLILGNTSLATQMALYIPIGRIGVGIQTPSEKIDVAGAVKATKFCLGASCIESWPAGGSGGGISGSGTSNQIPMFSGATNLADTNIYSNQGKVGIGSIFNNNIGGQQPSDTLDINGTIRIRQGSPAIGKVLTSVGADGKATWEPSAVLCSNSTDNTPCNAAESNNGTGNGVWRVVSCVRSVNGVKESVVAARLKYESSKWQWVNNDNYNDCDNGSALVMRISTW